MFSAHAHRDINNFSLLFQQILVLAVLITLITAPLGAVAISVSGPVLLSAPPSFLASKHEDNAAFQEEASIEHGETISDTHLESEMSDLKTKLNQNVSKVKENDTEDIGLTKF